MTGEAQRALLVDDHPVVRAGLRTFLSHEHGIEAVEECASLAEARTRLARLVTDGTPPTLVILDLKLEDGRGLALLPELRRDVPGARILVLSSFLEEDAVREAMAAGAHGWLDKQQGPEALADAVRGVMRGELPLAPAAVRALSARPAEDPFAALTRREREVLSAIAEGLSNREIAERLGVREKTVKTHAGHLFAKLGVRRRTQAARLAREHGL